MEGPLINWGNDSPSDRLKGTSDRAKGKMGRGPLDGGGPHLEDPTGFRRRVPLTDPSDQWVAVLSEWRASPLTVNMTGVAPLQRSADPSDRRRSLWPTVEPFYQLECPLVDQTALLTDSRPTL